MEVGGGGGRDGVELATGMSPMLLMVKDCAPEAEYVSVVEAPAMIGFDPSSTEHIRTGSVTEHVPIGPAPVTVPLYLAVVPGVTDAAPEAETYPTLVI